MQVGEKDVGTDKVVVFDDDVEGGFTECVFVRRVGREAEKHFSFLSQFVDCVIVAGLRLVVHEQSGQRGLPVNASQFGSNANIFSLRFKTSKTPSKAFLEALLAPIEAAMIGCTP